MSNGASTTNLSIIWNAEPLFGTILPFFPFEFARICDAQVLGFGDFCGFFEHFVVKKCTRFLILHEGA